MKDPVGCRSDNGDASRKKEPVFLSAMGRNGECYGIGVYPGYRSIAGYYRLLESPDKAEQIDPLMFQNCLMCYYGNRDELAPQEREIIKALNLRFRGENNWIYFRSMEEGYTPGSSMRIRPN